MHRHRLATGGQHILEGDLQGVAHHASDDGAQDSQVLPFGGDALQEEEEEG